MFKVYVSKPNPQESFEEMTDTKEKAMKVAFKHLLSSNYVQVYEGDRQIYRSARPSRSRLHQVLNN
jgi:hypothetical protein